jgi:hypothetical protein
MQHNPGDELRRVIAATRSAAAELHPPFPGMSVAQITRGTHDADGVRQDEHREQLDERREPRRLESTMTIDQTPTGRPDQPSGIALISASSS